MDTASIDSFWSESRGDPTWLGRSDLRSLHDPVQILDLDALQVALTKLDHSHQKGKASVGRSGALSHRRPPSRGSRSSKRSSADSLYLLLDQQELEEDLVIPRVVNIEVQVEKSEDKAEEEEDSKKEELSPPPPPPSSSSSSVWRKTESRPSPFEEQKAPPSPSKARDEEERGSCSSSVVGSEIRRRLFESRQRRSGALVGGSNPLLNHFSSEAEESFRRIKEEVTRLAAKRRSSSDISESRPQSECDSTQDYRQQLRRWSEEQESSILESASVALGREGEDNRSSSEADVVISDRESIADSGLVNRRTVITIHDKKSRSATSLAPEDDSTPLWVRDLRSRRSLRVGGKEEAAASRIIPIQVEDQDFDGGINVSIVSQAEPTRRDSTSRMYVRQSDSENRPSRASAFNVRRTIEKRQIQQERRERKALREQIREQLRSLSEGRERRDSSGSHVSSVHLSQNSVRSKSMSSLDQDDDFRSESPLFKVQSSPTLEKEKEGVRSYLFGVSNLTEGGDSTSCTAGSRIKSREEEVIIRETPDGDDAKKAKERPKTYAFERPELWQWSQSWDSLKSAQQDVEESKSRSVSKSVDSVRGSVTEKEPQQSREKNPEESKKPRSLERKLFEKSRDIEESSEGECSFVSFRKDSEGGDKDSLASLEPVSGTSTRPVRPPRRKKLSLSAGHITLEAEEKPDWIRLAKERRSLRSSRQVEELSDRASTVASKEPEWVARARKKLEALNVTLTSTTDFHSVSSHVTESSSAWSRGGLDALDDLREETSRIGEELAEEASARVNEELGLKEGVKMLEHSSERSREPSAERPRVSFDATSVEASETAESSRRYRVRKSSQKDEVRFGDLKHDWGGVQNKSSKTSSGKQKEMRFGEVQVKETLQDCPSPPVEKSKCEMRFGDHLKSQPTPKAPSHSSATSGPRPVMRFGDSPLDLFQPPEGKVNQNSSKFESIAGPDPTKMTAEQLNQNVEEYDFPIPTGKEDATELMRFLEESLRRTEVVPEVVTTDDRRPKPKSILKRRSVENVLHELKKEEKGEWLQKVEHRKSASFDWDSVGKGAEASLGTGYTRHPGSHHKPSRDHYSQHSFDLASNSTSNNLNFNHSKQSHDNLTTTTTLATNGSFFNVKLRHVPSNKREQPSPTNDHTLRFHLEQLQHRRSLATSDTWDGSTSRSTQGNGGVMGSSGGGDSHGSSSASSQESLSDSGGGGGGGGGGSGRGRRGRETGLYPAGEEEEGEGTRKEGRRRRSSSRSTGRARRDRSRAEGRRDSADNPCGRDGAEEVTDVKREARLREVLHRVSDTPAPASSWASCRSGRSFSATELLDSNVVPPATSSVPAEDQPSLPASSSKEEGSPTKEKLVVEVISEEEDAPSSRPSNVSLEAPKELDPPLKKDSGLASPQDEGSPTKEVPSVGSHPRLTPQTHTSHKTYFASIQLTPTVTHKVLSDGQASSTPATTEQDDSSTPAPKERGPTGADKEGQLSGTFVSQHTLEIQGAKSPAKVFSFTFSPTQSTRPDTVLADLKGSSIIPSSVRAEAREAGERKKEGREEKEDQNEKEEEEEEEEEEKMTRQIHEEKNVLRSESRRVFTVITNPNDGKRSHEKTNVNTEGSLNRHKTVKIIQQSEKSSGPKSPEVPAKPSWMKLVAQNLSNSSERRRTEEKGHEGGSSKAKAQQVTVEVVDEEEPRKRRSAKEEERRRSSLMEWEALQRQRLEDEEKNRINKNLSMKPVSAKIKELVKMHGSFMSMFSKDKKTDINGTVDGKDDILFRKIPSESSSFEVNEAVKDNTVPMKSPYIVRKLLSPLKQPSPQEVTPPQRASRKEAHKSSSSAHKSPRTSRRDSSKPRTGEGRRDASPHKVMSDIKRETTSVNGHHRYSSSSPSSRYRKAPITDPTPLDSSSTSKEKEAPVRSTRTPHSPSRSNEVKARHKDAAHTPKVTRKSSSSVDERSKVTLSSSKDKKVKESKSLKAESDLNGAADESPNSFSHEQRRSEGRSSIKDPHNRREWVSRMLTTISDDHLALLEDKGSKSTASPPEPPPSPRKGRDKPSEGRAFPNLVSEEVVSSSSPASVSPAPTPPARKSSSSHRGLSSEPLASSTPTKTKFTSSFDSSEATPSSSSPIKPAIPTKPLSSLSKPSVSTDAPTASPKLSPSPPNTPTSLRSSLRDTLQSDSSNRRGPVSLSSILGDQSSRSSSRASTPLTSPRATPERVIRKDSLDQVPKLDVIPESSLGSPYLRARAAESALRASESPSRTTGSVSTADITLRTPDSTSKGFESGPRSSGRRLGTSVVEDQKENIAPSPIPQRSSEAKGNKVGEEGRTSANFSPSSYRSSFRLRDKSEERKEEDRKVTAKNNANASWRPSSYKPFTFGKPSVTLKAMTTGVDPQRVSTSKNTNVKREQKTETTALQNLKTDSVRAETKAGQPTTIKMEPNLPLSDESESPISTRFSTERKSLRSRISTNDSQSPRAESKTSNSLEDKVSLLPGSSSTFTRYSKDRVSQRSREISERSTPDRDTSGPVSLSSILTRDVAPKTSTGDDSTDFQFKPRLSFSEELNDITLKYRNDLTARRASSDMTQDDDEVFNSDAARGSSVEPESKEASPSREIKPRVRDRKKSEGERSRTSKEGSPAPKGLPKSSSSSSRAKSTRLVRRNSSLKRNRPEESSATSRPTAKKERKDSEDDPADLKTETLVQDPSGWTKTRTTVRRARLGSSEKTRQIARTNSGRNKKEKAFKTDASKALEEWAAGTKVPGKLMKKEGQRFSHETEEEVKHGQKTSRSVVRRVVRRGSRKMSGGGELLTETKETSSTGAKKGQDTQEETKVRSSGEGHEVTTYEPEDGLSRKMKTSTDGERYMTQSVSNKGGKMTFTTEGVNNKTTKSVEVIGGDDFEAQRKVEGKTGHRVVVESSTDLGRPSTVVKKVTSQSRVIITKTKRKTPVVV